VVPKRSKWEEQILFLKTQIGNINYALHRFNWYAWEEAEMIETRLRHQKKLGEMRRIEARRRFFVQRNKRI